MLDCTICFQPIDITRRGFWYDTFRAVYRCEGSVYLSDIGTVGITSPDTYHVDLRVESQDPSEEPVSRTNIRLPLESTASPVWWMHDACWKILDVNLRRPICLTRLYEVIRIVWLKGLPTPYLLPKHHPPTEVTEFQNLLPPLKPLPTRSSRVHKLQSAQSEANGDVFHNLPQELRHEIASYLPTPDFYNLRLASRSMDGIFFSQSFWGTRFQCHGDRCFLCSPEGGRPKIPPGGNWHLLYYWTHEKALSKRLRVRRDIWLRCRLISSVMDSRLLFPRPARSTATKNLRWQHMNTHLPSSLPLVYFGRIAIQPSYNGYFSLPQSLIRIAVSLLGDAHQTYITGMEFIGENETVKIGHIGSQNRIIRDIRPFRGFKIAWSREGVHAIKFNTNARDSSWIGKVGAISWVCDMSVASNVAAVHMMFDKLKLLTIDLGLTPLV